MIYREGTNLLVEVYFAQHVATRGVWRHASRGILKKKRRHFHIKYLYSPYVVAEIND